VSRADGVSEEELDALSDYAASSLFDERERAALAYAEAITVHSMVPEELFARLKRSFDEAEIIELTAAVAWEICAAKFNRALEIEAQGVCRIALPGTTGNV
jgi:alkylhydroperoxidase family enzyme